MLFAVIIVKRENGYFTHMAYFMPRLSTASFIISETRRIDQSNITISTYTNRPIFVASIHSCSQFDYKAILAYLKNVYQPKSLRYKYITETDLKGE
jgi:hypothetical protein